VETTIGSRLALIRGEKTQAKFAEELGVHKNSLGNYERNGRTPDAEFLRKMIEAGYSANWLLYEIGEMHLSKDYPTVRPVYQDESVTYDSSVNTEYAYVEKLVDVHVSAGGGAEPSDGDGIEELAFKRKWLAMEGLSAKNLRVVACRGDSMTPTIPEDSTLLVDLSQNDFVREGIYVIRLDGHLFAKRLQRGQGGAILVISDNTMYSPIPVLPGQKDLQIIGKVVWLGHTM